MIRSSYWLGGRRSATSEKTCAKSTANLHHIRQSYDCLSPIFILTRWPEVTHVRRDMCQVNCHPAPHKTIFWLSISSTEIQMIRSSYWLNGQRSPTSEETCAKSTANLHHIRQSYDCLSLIFILTRWPEVTHVRRDMCQVNCHPAPHKTIFWLSISSTEIQMIRSSYWLGGQGSATSEETCAKSTAILHHIRQSFDCLSPQQRFKWSDLHIDSMARGHPHQKRHLPSQLPSCTA